MSAPPPGPSQFGGMSRFSSVPRPGSARPASSSTPSSSARPLSQFQRSTGSSLGLGLGKKGAAKRHTKQLRDTIQGISEGDMRRLARRGGVKRISKTIYGDIRLALRERLQTILRRAAIIVESSERKTITVTDIVFTLNQLGAPIYGPQPDFHRSR